MGPKLRQFVESKLLLDLNRYMASGSAISSNEVHFDWSESCVEGHRSFWLDGEIENFSNVALFDTNKKMIAEGWMEFIETEVGIEVFWWFLRSGSDYSIQSKISNHVPRHIWDKLSDNLRKKWAEYAPTMA